MSQPSGKLRALLATARIANVPSVVSNVWVGVVVGCYAFSSDEIPFDVPWWSVVRLFLAGICLYIAGNFFNDWHDRCWDSSHRPERALPRGIFSPITYAIAGSVLAAAGIILSLTVNRGAGLVAGAIGVAIVIYTVWHKRAAWAVVPMGICRGLLPILGAVGVVEGTPNPGFWVAPVSMAGGIFCYIVGLSMSARYESAISRDNGSVAWPTVLFLLAPFLMLFTGLLGVLIEGKLEPLMFLGLVPYIGWLVVCRTSQRRPVSRYVSALLAGIPAVDWIALLPASLVILAMPSQLFLDDSIGWLSLIIPPLAFVSALLLQRIAPAT